MAKSTIKIKAKMKGDLTEVKALIKHPMETGQRKNGKGEKIPAHYITTVEVKANDKVVMEANWGTAVSKNPFLSFAYKGAKGDKITLTWKDNKDESDTLEAEVK